MKKVISALMVILSISMLSACTFGSMDQAVVTLKGGKITEQEIYTGIKRSDESNSTLQNMIINKIFFDKYGSKVKDQEIDKEYKEIKEQLGDNFDSQLKTAGLTKDTLKKRIKENLSYQKGLESHVKITETDLKSAWKTFHPEVEAQIIKLSDEEKAKAVKASADKGEDFSKLAKDQSTDTATKKDGGKVTFNSQTTTIPTEVKEAAFKLKEDAISDVIASLNTATYAYDYYVVKMIKDQSKGDSLDKYKDELKEIVKQTKLNDNEFTVKVISEELKEANVKIKDKELSGVLKAYTTTDTSGEKTNQTQTTTTSK